MKDPLTKLFVIACGSLWLSASGCRLTGSSPDHNTNIGGDTQRACEQLERKVWDKASQKCFSAEEACFQKKDGSIWMNGTCLSKAHQCQLDGGSWEKGACKNPEQICQEKPGFTWRDGKCLTSKENCRSQKNSYRYRWIAAYGDAGLCRTKQFIDYCQEATAAPRAVQYTVAILKRRANNTDACGAAEQWLHQTVSTTGRLELYDTQDRLQVEDLSPLIGLTGLKELILTNNKVADLSPLAGLKDLRVLDLQNNQVTDLDGLESLVHLESLFLGHNRVTSLSPLAGLTSLKRLHLFDNRLNDLVGLEKLVGLEVLYLKTNAIHNILPLRNLQNLRELDLRENPLYSPTLVKGPNNCPIGPQVAPKVSALCQELMGQEEMPKR